MKLLSLMLSVSVLFFVVGSASAAHLNEAQRAYIDRSLQERDLNVYGDPKDTVYAGGNPLFDEVSGQSIDRYDYILKKHPGILDGFVGILPVDGVERVVSSAARLGGDLGTRRSPAQLISDAEAHGMTTGDLIESIRVAVDARDYQAIRDLLSKVSGLRDDQLRPFSSVLRETRRMLSMPTIQPIGVTSQIAELMTVIGGLERRIR
ncbi:MAG: hypothetical protein HY815_20870 [Candidatus Riflebacteria bacterium]|nr:hypothetical protein [Candidatus Riflebacteria bacterium]